MCLAFAMATDGRRMLRKIEGGIGRLCDHVQKLFLDAGGELRLHAKVEEILTADGRVTGVRLTTGETITAPVVVANLDPTMTFTRLLDPDVVPDEFRARVDGVAHQAPYLQVHFALSGLPEFEGDFVLINEGVRRRVGELLQPTGGDATRLRRLPAWRDPAEPVIRAANTKCARPRVGTTGQARGERVRDVPADRGNAEGTERCSR